VRWGRTRGGYNGDSNPEGGSAVLLRIRVRDGHSDRSRKHAARLNRRAVAARVCLLDRRLAFVGARHARVPG